jgi:ABC-type nitrate/sulfonate/bicarbonate transport system substrate-binding protein
MNDVTKVSGGALLAALLFAVPAAAPAQTRVSDVSLAINAPGGGNWPVYIADQQGFFKGEGLNVSIVTSGSNVNTINMLATGAANFALDGSDIEIEAAARKLPMKIIAPEFGPNPYTLVAKASIASWADLKGKRIVLGSPQDVSSLTFEAMAQAQHLSLADFDVSASPSSSSRYTALLSGSIEATVLSQPFDILAQEQGLRVLQTASDLIKVWADTCFAVNTTWAATPANRDAAVRFVRALRKAVAFGYANQAGAVAALVKATNIAQTTADKSYEIDFKQKKVFTINDKTSLAPGLAAMAAIAVKGGAMTTVPPAGDYFDPSYLQASLR